MPFHDATEAPAISANDPGKLPSELSLGGRFPGRWSSDTGGSFETQKGAEEELKGQLGTGAFNFSLPNSPVHY